jgi:hypothetical protein
VLQFNKAHDQIIQVHVISTTVDGILNWPKLPNLLGILDFHGDVKITTKYRFQLRPSLDVDLVYVRASYLVLFCRDISEYDIL